MSAVVVPLRKISFWKATDVVGKVAYYAASINPKKLYADIVEEREITREEFLKGFTVAA